jgi:hypothetical protein
MAFETGISESVVKAGEGAAPRSTEESNVPHCNCHAAGAEGGVQGSNGRNRSVSDTRKYIVRRWLVDGSITVEDGDATLAGLIWDSPLLIYTTMINRFLLMGWMREAREVKCLSWVVLTPCI